MSHNLNHIDKRLEKQRELSKQAAESADEKAWKRAETEIRALKQMRKFYTEHAN